MSQRIRRRLKKSRRRNHTRNDKDSGLQLENLERRVLLDVAGFWDEMGWRSASGGGVTWDVSGDPSESQLVLSSDGDPVVFWIDDHNGSAMVDQIGEFGSGRVPYHWEARGSIYARQYADALGWWDFSPGSGDDRRLGAIDTTEVTDPDEAARVLSAISGHANDSLIQVWEGDTLRVNSESCQMAVAAGPNGQIAVVWVAAAIPDGDDDGEDDEIYGKLWDGTHWSELGNSALGGGISNDDVVNEKPDVAINDLGEVFVSYTAIHPLTAQREIIVKKFGYDYDGLDGPPTEDDLVWTELVNEGVDLFGVHEASGVSNDLANSFDSSIAVDTEGRPVVVWTSDNFEGNMEIYLKRWDGDSWEEMGTGSASDADTDGLSGVSNDPGVSIQPDLAVADSGDVIVTWVNWADWTNYKTSGQAGVYVKKLEAGSNQWTEYEAGVSTTGAGIAPERPEEPATLEEEKLGWYYTPTIDLDSAGNPLIAWQQWWPNQTTEPIITHPDVIYASYFKGGTFGLLDTNDGDLKANFYGPASANGAIGWFDCWMPSPLINADDEPIMAFTWHDLRFNGAYHGGAHIDNEIFVQRWDADGETWVEYGRGSTSHANDVFAYPGTEAVQFGMVEGEDPNNMDVFLANGQHLYRYSRQTDTWTLADPEGGYGTVFDLRGEPEIEYDVAGSPLLAYISDTDALPYVLQWDGTTWDMVGGGAASATHGNGDGISVQVGPGGKILLVYVATDGASGTSEAIARVWNPSVGSWQDAATGVVPLDEGLQAIYYADYDGFDFDDYGELNDGSYDNDGNRVYELGAWYFWSLDPNGGDTTLAGMVEAEITDTYDDVDGDGTAEPAGFSGADDDNGVLIEFTIPESGPPAVGTNVVGEVNHQFELIEAGDVIIELAYALDSRAWEDIRATENFELEFYLTLDGSVVDAVVGGGALDPIDTIGVQENQAYTAVTFDTNALGIGPLSAGRHTVGVQAKAVSIAIPPEEFDFNDGAAGADFTAWVSDPDPAEANTEYAWDANAAGAGNSGILMTLGLPASTADDTDLELAATYTFVGGGDVTIDFDYRMFTGAIDGDNPGETLSLIVEMDGDDDDQSPISIEQSASTTDSFSYTFVDVGPGEHTVTIRGELTNSPAGVTSGIGLDNIDVTYTEAGVEQRLQAMIDNVAVYQRIVGSGDGTGDWEFTPAGGDVNENSFQACIHSSLAAAGTESYTVEDVSQADDGRMVISFRYRYVGGAASDTLTVHIDDPSTAGVIEYSSDSIETGNIDSEWTWVRIIATDLPPKDLNNWETLVTTQAGVSGDPTDIAMGTYDVIIELDADGAADLWIDNLAILTTQPTSAILPRATLLPTGTAGSERNFAVAITNETLGLKLYADEDTDEEGATRPFSDGTVDIVDVDNDGDGVVDGDDWDVLNEDIQNGYYSSLIMELDTATDTWEQYGDTIEKTAQIDFLGFSNAKYEDPEEDEWNDTWAAEHLGSHSDDDSDPDREMDPLQNERDSYRFAMPGNEMYQIEDLAIGINAVEWVATQHAVSSWTDLDDDGINETFEIEFTDLDILVWRWDNIDTYSWVDTLFPTNQRNRVYTNVQLAGSGHQDITVAWTDRDSEGPYYGSRANRYFLQDSAWSLLGTESVQNGNYWSGLLLTDMVVKADGFPIVGFFMGHMGSVDGVREFRRAETLPDMEISEFSGTPDDNILDFGTITNITETEGFSIFNNGPGDLLIYNVQIGGIGTLDSLPSNPFSFFDLPEFPVTLAPDQQEAINVRFNPANVPAGEYSAVLLVHSNNGAHPSHPFTHFQEIILTVEVSNGADASINTNFLNFDDTVINETSAAREVVISNQGGGPLTVHQWLFDGNNFDIAQAFITDSDGIAVQTSTDNTASLTDDVVVPADGFLTLQVTFNPDDIAVFNETFYIQTNDDDEPFMAVALVGQGTNNAQIVVEEDSGTQQNDDIIDFGNVIMGTISDPISITIRNDGTTDMEVSEIAVDDSAALEVSIVYVGPASSAPFTLVPGASTEIYVYYAPTVPELTGGLVPVELETAISIISDDRVMPAYEITVQALAIPVLPILVVTDESGVEMAMPRRLSFSTINVGEQLEQAFLIKNEGGDDLTLERFVIAAVYTPFTIEPINTASSDDDIVLGFGQTQMVTVTFTPTTAGTIQNTLGIVSDDRDVPNAITEIILQGTAVNPELGVTDSYGDPDDLFVDFGEIIQHQSGSASITMENKGGSGSIVVSGWSVSDPAFSIDPPFISQVTIGPGQQQVLDVIFTPTTIGQFTDSIAISYLNPLDLGEEIEYDLITITGESVIPGRVIITDSELDSDPGVIEFTKEGANPVLPLLVGLDTAQHTVTLTNDGDSDLLIKGILTTSVYGDETPGSWSEVELTSSPFQLNIPNRGRRMDPDNAYDDLLLGPDQSMQVAVAFMPANKYDGQAWITIVTNDPSQHYTDTINHVLVSGQSVFAIQVGELAGSKQPKAAFLDDDGDRVRVKVTGGGYAVVVLENGAGSGSDIERIELANTTGKTKLTVTSQDQTHIGQILGDTVKNITLKNMVLDGEGVTGNAINIDTLTGTLTTGAIINGADIYIGGINDNSKGAKIKLQTVEDGSDLTVEAPVALLSMSSYGDGTIEADSINKLKVSQKAFDANVVIENDLNSLIAKKSTFTGSLNADNANKMTFNNLRGADIGIRESLKKLTVKTNVEDSRIVAGYDLDTKSLFSGGNIDSVNVKGLFSNSHIAAGVAPYSDTQFFHPSFQNELRNGGIGNVVLGDVTENNYGLLFGVSAASTIDKVQVNNITFHPDSEQVDFRILLL